MRLHSVMPYIKNRRAWGSAARKRCTVRVGSAAAALVINRIAPRSTLDSCGTSRRAVNKVGTPGSTVTRSRCRPCTSLIGKAAWRSSTTVQPRPKPISRLYRP